MNTSIPSTVSFTLIVAIGLFTACAGMSEVEKQILQKTTASGTASTINEFIAQRGIEIPPFPKNAYKVFDKGLLDVTDGHAIHYSQAGNPNGVPVVFVHGGPGGGASDGSRRMYDPQFYRIIIFDQRGSAKSKAPSQGILYKNTIFKIVDDMEALRKHVGVEKWILSGGSSGSAISLIYAIQHPERVIAMSVHGITFLTRDEIRWTGWLSSDLWADKWHGVKNMLDENGIPVFKPSDLENFDAFVLAGYREVVQKKNRKLAFAVLNMGMRETHIDANLPKGDISGETAFKMAQIIWHMWYSDFFLPPNYVERNLHKIKHIPGFILAGRYDTNTVLKSAWKLHMHWPKASLLIYTGAHADDANYKRWTFRVLQSALTRSGSASVPSLSITKEDFAEQQWPTFRKSLDSYYLKEGLGVPEPPAKKDVPSITEPTGF